MASMVVPLDGIRAIHNAFRMDMAQIDAAALELARGKPEQAAIFERFRFFNEVLEWHATGEEAGVFPALEGIVPEIAWTYVRDHRGLDAAYEDLNRSYIAGDSLQTARASAVLHFHLKIHLAKEDTHLYQIFAKRIPLPEQMKAMNTMAGSIPKERFPELVAWWFPLIGLEDRENMTRIWQMVLPPPVFAGVREVIKKVSGSDWDELRRRITDL
jgi:hypothetical protein